MKKILLYLALFALFANTLQAQPSMSGFSEVSKEDGTSACYGYSLKFLNAPTDNNDGSCSVDMSSVYVDVAGDTMTGSLGIGTSTPDRALHIASDLGSVEARILAHSSTASTDAGTLTLGRTRGTEASPTAITAGDTLGRIRSLGYDTAESVNNMIKFVASSEWGTAGDTTDEPTQIEFYTIPDGSGSPVEAMRIAEDGTTSHLDGNINNVGDISLDTISSDAATTVSVTLGVDAGDDFIVGNNNALVVEGDNDRVGIGTASPTSLLHLSVSTDRDGILIEGEGVSTVATGYVYSSVQTYHGMKFNGARARNTKANPDYPNDIDLLFAFNGGGWTGSTMDPNAGARLTVFADGNWGASSAGSKWQFGVNDGTTNWNGDSKTMTLRSSGRLGIIEPNPTAQLHVDQSSTTAAIPVMKLDQGDVSEPFIDFIGTATADANSSISTLNTSGATTDHIQIDLNGVKAWIAVSTNNPI